MTTDHNEGRDCLCCLNATRRVVNLPEMDAMPQKQDDEPWSIAALWVIGLFAVAFLSGAVDALFTHLSNN